MIDRRIAPFLAKAFKEYPFVTVTGPRQSGKTTLCKKTFPDLKYVNLEAPDEREYARSDPRGFLRQIEDGAIIDEVQRVPDLVSYLQVHADERGKNGQYVLTGSQNLNLSRTVSQSLSGRTRLLNLLPYSIGERRATGAGNAIEEILYTGFYPRIFDQRLQPSEVYSDCFSTYVERDVRQLAEIRNISSFERFVRLCAGRVGQLTDFVKLGADAGVSHTTARNWLETLETSYIVFRLYPHAFNIRRQMVKSPKLYFYDVGLASYLLGIENPDQVVSHPLRGALFENMIVVEALKYRLNSGRPSNLSFFRDKRGLESDLLVEMGTDLIAMEIKSGATIASDVFTSLNKISKLDSRITKIFAVYGGDQHQQRSDGSVIPFDDIYDELNRLDASRQIFEIVEEKLNSNQDHPWIDSMESAIDKFVLPLIDEVGIALDAPELERVVDKIDVATQLWYKDVGRKINLKQQSKTLTELVFEHILPTNGHIGEEISIWLIHDYTLTGAPAQSIFDKFTLQLRWFFNDRGFVQTISIDGESVQALQDRVNFGEMNSKKPEISRICASIYEEILREIE